MPSISKELLNSYCATDFHVFSESPFVLKIGQNSKDLAEIHHTAGVSSSAFITAYNPYSAECTDEQNLEAQSRLLKSINLLGLKTIQGEGRDSKGKWPGEPSLLVLGCENAQAQELGRLFQQNAIVWCGENVVPELVVLVP